MSHEFLLLLPAKRTTLFSRGNIRCLPRDIFDYNIESWISLTVVDDIAWLYVNTDACKKKMQFAVLIIIPESHTQLYRNLFLIA